MNEGFQNWRWLLVLGRTRTASGKNGVSKVELSYDITTQRYWAEHCSPSGPTAAPWQLLVRTTLPHGAPPYSMLRKEVSSCSSLRLAPGVEGESPLRLLRPIPPMALGLLRAPGPPSVCAVVNGGVSSAM